MHAGGGVQPRKTTVWASAKSSFCSPLAYDAMMGQVGGVLHMGCVVPAKARAMQVKSHCFRWRCLTTMPPLPA
jgi:hypothetical protein